MFSKPTLKKRQKNRKKMLTLREFNRCRQCVLSSQAITRKCSAAPRTLLQLKASV